MKILLTGGFGLIGSSLCKVLLDEDHDVTILDDFSSSSVSSTTLKCKFVKMNCSDIEGYTNLDSDFDCIIHVAGQASKEISIENPLLDINSNLMSTLNLLEFARKTNCKRFIFTSSMCVYDESSTAHNEDEEISDLQTPYSINKYTSELYIKLYKNIYDIEYTILRIFTCYGINQSTLDSKKGIISIFKNQFLDDNLDYIEVKGSLKRVRDFIFVEDVSNIINICIHNRMFYNETINIGTGINTTILQMLNTMSELLNIKKKYIEKNRANGDMHASLCNNRKLNRLLGYDYRFTSLQNGLSQIL